MSRQAKRVSNYQNAEKDPIRVRIGRPANPRRYDIDWTENGFHWTKYGYGWTKTIYNLSNEENLPDQCQTKK
jgi:hypothetical protein